MGCNFLNHFGREKKRKKCYEVKRVNRRERMSFEAFVKDENKRAREERGRVTKRAESWSPRGGCDQPGQHFICVASCWLQREENGMAQWSAGHRACQADGRLCTGQTVKCRHKSIHIHTLTTLPLQTSVIDTKQRLKVTQKGVWNHVHILMNIVMQVSSFLEELWDCYRPWHDTLTYELGEPIKIENTVYQGGRRTQVYVNISTKWDCPLSLCLLKPLPPLPHLK